MSTTATTTTSSTSGSPISLPAPSSTTTASTLTTPMAPSSPIDQHQPTYGTLRYIPPNHTPTPSPHNFHLPALCEFADVRRMPLHDIPRPLPSLTTPTPTPATPATPATEGHIHPQLATHGFTPLHHPTTLHRPPYSLSSWKDPSLLAQHYVPETEAMLKRLVGCSEVVTETLLLRSQVWREEDALARHGRGNGSDSTAIATDHHRRSSQAADDSHDANEQQEAKNLKEMKDLETSFPQFIGFDSQEGGASPAPKIHVDFAPSGARLHVRNYHPRLRKRAGAVIVAEERLLREGLEGVGMEELGDREFGRRYRGEVCGEGEGKGEGEGDGEGTGKARGPRWALYSIWRPLTKVKRDPLALGDVRTFRDEDYVSCNIRMPFLGRRGEVDSETGTAKQEGETAAAGTLREGELEAHDSEAYLARYSAGQKWYWIREQEPEEVLVIGLWDSGYVGEGRDGGGTFHSSVEVDGQEGVEEARESLELRCLAIW